MSPWRHMRKRRTPLKVFVSQWMLLQNTSDNSSLSTPHRRWSHRYGVNAIGPVPARHNCQSHVAQHIDHRCARVQPAAVTCTVDGERKHVRVPPVVSAQDCRVTFSADSICTAINACNVVYWFVVLITQITVLNSDRFCWFNIAILYHQRLVQRHARTDCVQWYATTASTIRRYSAWRWMCTEYADMCKSCCEQCNRRFHPRF
jgi:hypothetical protein